MAENGVPKSLAVLIDADNCYGRREDVVDWSV